MNIPPPPEDEEDGDGWDDDEDSSTPQIIGTYRVIKDYIPETNATLTLILDDLVYVFKKTNAQWWEGETKGVYGKFPAANVGPIKENEK